MILLKNVLKLDLFLYHLNLTEIFCFDTITGYKLLKTMATFQKIIVPIGTCILHLVHVY